MRLPLLGLGFWGHRQSLGIIKVQGSEFSVYGGVMGETEGSYLEILADVHARNTHPGLQTTKDNYQHSSFWHEDC